MLRPRLTLFILTALLSEFRALLSRPFSSISILFVFPFNRAASVYTLLLALVLRVSLVIRDEIFHEAVILIEFFRGLLAARSATTTVVLQLTQSLIRFSDRQIVLTLSEFRLVNRLELKARVSSLKSHVALLHEICL